MVAVGLTFPRGLGFLGISSPFLSPGVLLIADSPYSSQGRPVPERGRKLVQLTQHAAAAIAGPVGPLRESLVGAADLMAGSDPSLPEVIEVVARQLSTTSDAIQALDPGSAERLQVLVGHCSDAEGPSLHRFDSLVGTGMTAVPVPDGRVYMGSPNAGERFWSVVDENRRSRPYGGSSVPSGLLSIGATAMKAVISEGREAVDAPVQACLLWNGGTRVVRSIITPDVSVEEREALDRHIARLLAH